MNTLLSAHQILCRYYYDYLGHCPLTSPPFNCSNDLFKKQLTIKGQECLCQQKKPLPAYIK